MFPTRCVKWPAMLVLAAAMLVLDAHVVRADAWSSSNDCGCGNQHPAMGSVTPQPGFCSSRPFWMRPTPTYNSSWARVPVTNYRPQVVNDPLTGVNFTSIQPCNTYEWQARRTAGCSLWHRFVNWWQSHCCCLSRPPMSHCAPSCAPASGSIVSSGEAAASPYYTPAPSGVPSTNGRLVPVPSSVSPPSPVPADRRPQLDPTPQRTSREGSASRPFRPEAEVFVAALVDVETTLELTPPLVGPDSYSADTDVADDRATMADETSYELLPMNTSVPTASFESEIPTNSGIPTDEVWDDSGWRSEQ